MEVLAIDNDMGGFVPTTFGAAGANETRIDGIAKFGNEYEIVECRIANLLVRRIEALQGRALATSSVGYGQVLHECMVHSSSPAHLASARHTVRHTTRGRE